MTLEPGTRLGPYEITDAVGAGGMGEVYRATDTRLDRTVAIKVLPSHLSNHPDLKQRFDREAKTISSLQHPHICSLFDVGHENGTDFLVMEYIEGETLAKRLEGGALPADDLLSMGVQITEALDAAHKAGVIHRDLKPGNIMLTKSGVKLLDFGLAKTAGAVTSQSSMTQLATEQQSGDPLTAEGTILGTFQYMSPEQLEGAEADARSDIFALGAVLYEMATGHKAFEGKSQASLIASIMSSSPQPITAIQPLTPPALDQVIRTCLQKDPDARWQTAHDVALQIKWIAEGGSQAGIPRPVASRRRTRERTAWLAAAVAGAAALAMAAMLFLQPAPEPPRSVRFNIHAPADVGSFGSPRISPDGQYIAFNGIDSTGTSKMWIRPLSSLEAYALPGTEGCNRPFWSPDSRHVGFFANAKLKRVPITGGPPLTLCEFSNGADGVWGSGGIILFDGGPSDSIQAVPAGGGVPTAASIIDRERGENSHGWPDFLPDGKRFVFLKFITGKPNEIHVGELGTFETRKLTEADSRIEFVPPSFLMYETNGSLLAHPFDPEPAEFIGDPFPFAEGIGQGASGLAHFSGSNNGTLIFTGGDTSERQLVWFDRGGRELKTIAETDRYSNAVLSPDGNHVVTSVFDEGTSSSDLWLIDLNRGVRSRFTFDAATDNDAVWTLDGKRVLFRSSRGGDSDVWAKNASGTGRPELVLDTDDRTGPVWLSRDGQTLVTNSRTAHGWDVLVYDLATPDTPQEIATSPDFVEAWAAVSPDGRYVAYASNESGGFEIYLVTMPVGGGKWQVSLRGGTEPTWRRDGKELYFLAPDRSLMAVEMSLDGRVEIGQPRRLFGAPVPRSIAFNHRYYPAADGQSFLILALLEREQVPPTTVILNWTAELDER
jgi:serine/threonine protein kinase